MGMFGGTDVGLIRGMKGRSAIIGVFGGVGLIRGMKGRSAIIGVFGGTVGGISKIGGANRGMNSIRGVGGTTRAAVIVKLGERGYLTKCEGLSVET